MNSFFFYVYSVLLKQTHFFIFVHTGLVVLKQVFDLTAMNYTLKEMFLYQNRFEEI